MNQNIKHLAEQAGFMEAWFSESGDDCEREIKKFAELIVRGCVAQCDKNKDHEWLGAGSKVSAFNIKQHFGVEE